MLLQRLHKSKTVTSAVALLLSVSFAGMVMGPMFLGAQTTGQQPPPAYNPPTPAADFGSGDFGDPFGRSGASEPPNYVEVPQYTPDFITTDSKPAATPPPTIQEKQRGAAEAAARQLNQAEALAAAFTCDLFPPGVNLGGCLAWVMDQAMWLSARTLWIAGVLFNITLDYTLNLNTLLEKLPVVDIGWKVLRDISNIIFIFVVLYSGISITLGIGGGKPGWGLIANVVLVALFINFSLFISKTVVDASNVAALHFYSLIVKQSGDTNAKKTYDKGLSEAFLYGLQLSTIYNSKQLGAGGGFDASRHSLIGSAGQSAGKELSFANIILIGFFGSVFIITTAWVFFAAAIMFIYRAVMLIFLMMLSPLAFVGLILPGASGMAHQWWSKLWSQAFFAPLYLALAYVVAFTINSPAFRQGLNTLASGETVPSFAAAITGTGANTVAVIFNFVILIGLMVGCLMVAQQLGAKGSEMAMAGWEKIKGGAINVVGATTRGIIKAPATLIQAGGNVGKGVGGFGKTVSWMATNKWLNNKYLGNFKDTAFGKRMSMFGEKSSKWGAKWQGEAGAGAKVRKVTKKGEWLDPRYWEERADQSKWGNWLVGKAIRSVTTGALANVKIGDRSLKEAYEEGEEMASKRRERTYGNIARENATELEKLYEQEKHLLDERLKAEEAINKTEEQIAEAKKKGKSTATLEKQRKNQQKTLKDAKDAVTKFKDSKGGKMNEYTSRIQEALSQMSVEAFIELPKVFFENSAFMDLSVLGQDKHAALMKSEHFTKEEKEDYTRARWKRTEEAANRRKARNERYIKGLMEYQKGADDYQGEVQKIEKGLELPKLEEDFKTELTALNQALKTAAEELADAAHDPARSAEIDAKKKGVADARQAVENRRYKFEKDKATKIAGRDAEIKAKNLAKPVKPMLQPGWEEVPEIRKALRNILRPEEVINLYRYNRKAFGNEMIADTIKQSTWNLVRNTGEIDSNSMEQARVDKRHYVQHAGDLDAGLDTLMMQELGKIDPGAAKEIREKFHKQLVAVGHLDYFKHFDDVEDTWKDELGREWETLGKILKKTFREHNLSDDVGIEERKLRSKTGNTMYDEVALNLANDEFQMMPGILRNMLIVRRHLGRSTAPDYDKRDLEDTLPHVETWLEEFKRAMLGQGEITRGTLEVLNWLVNEDRGQRFTKFESLRNDLKPVFEFVKGYAANTARAQRSIYKSEEALLNAVEDYRREHGAVSAEFENLFEKAGMKGELFNPKEK